MDIRMKTLAPAKIKYQDLTYEFNPVILHSEINAKFEDSLNMVNSTNFSPHEDKDNRDNIVLHPISIDIEGEIVEEVKHLHLSPSPIFFSDLCPVSHEISTHFFDNGGGFFLEKKEKETNMINKESDLGTILNRKDVMGSYPSVPPMEIFVSEGRKEEEIKLISEYLCDVVVDELMDKFLDEICDKEEAMRQKELLIKAFLNPDDSLSLEEIDLILINVRETIKEDNMVLGIATTTPSKGFPECAKSLKKRGRKSTQELSVKDGEVIGKTKLTDIFCAGKGKVLPNSP